jgi:hypothetical protein
VWLAGAATTPVFEEPQPLLFKVPLLFEEQQLPKLMAPL